jgi:hypothetical protein
LVFYSRARYNELYDGLPSASLQPTIPTTLENEKNTRSSSVVTIMPGRQSASLLWMLLSVGRAVYAQAIGRAFQINCLLFCAYVAGISIVHVDTP